MNLGKLYLNYCEEKGLEINQNQTEIVGLINTFYQTNFNNFIFLDLFSKKSKKIGFYLYGDVGVGKTMILDFFYENFNPSKKKFHFNQFMINFHDFAFQNKNNKKENVIDKFVKKLKQKYKLIYFDEFQVTNIVDAMILGNLFKKIFDQNIKVIFSSNTKISDLYKEGLQREQFLPFIKIMMNKCFEKKLVIKEDYRKSKKNRKEGFFYPLNRSTNFKINQLFRQMTVNKTKQEKILSIKGRKVVIKNFYEGYARFDFKDLCDKNIGAEDYIKIAEACNFMVIENVPNFNNQNSDQQNRFITLIDILYEKKISLLISCVVELRLIKSSLSLAEPFKRTLSRLFELTSNKFN